MHLNGDQKFNDINTRHGLNVYIVNINNDLDLTFNYFTPNLLIMLIADQ